MARISSFSREIGLMLDRRLSPKARSAMIADRAREALAEAQAVNRGVFGTVPEHATFVDGRASEQLASVDPDKGVIVFAFQIRFELFEFIGRLLLEHSPVLTGEYQDSHRLYADGVEVPGFDPRLKVEEWVFTTPLPYARKIERGLSDQAPDGVYEAVAALASQRFGNQAAIKFTFREVVGGAGRNPAISVSMR